MTYAGENNRLFQARQIAGGAALFASVGLYAAIASFGTIVSPLLAPVFLLPLLFTALLLLPAGVALSRRFFVNGIYLATGLLAIWPIYLHAKFGPLPIITPPRLLIYVLIGLWAIDLTRSRIRRARLAFVVRQNRLLMGLIVGLFGLGALSLPFAEGRSLAAPEFIRQLIIWLMPFLVVLTYIRRRAELVTIVKILVIAGAIQGAIAIAEQVSGVLLASVLAPIIPDNAEWLRIAQAQKIRDGVFRAQAIHTHPLALAEYLSIIAPFAVVLAARARRMAERLFWLSASGFVVIGALATNSRAAILAIAISVLTVFGLFALRFLRRANDPRFSPLVALCALFLLCAAPVIFLGAAQFISGGDAVSASNSSQARLDQIKMAWPKIMERPVLGYGVGRATRILGYWGKSLTLDNYYLTLALDMGLAAPIIFVAMIAGIGRSAYALSLRGPRRDQLVFAGFVAFAASFLLCRMILSLTGNIALVYMLLAAFMGVRAYLTPIKSRRVRYG